MLSIKNFKLFYLLSILLLSFATQANDSPEKPLTGKYTEKYHNGNLKYEVNYVNGKKEGLEIFRLAVKNAAPLLEVKSRRVGGANYQVPIEVSRNRQFFLGAHWIINSARSRSGRSMSDRLASELISAANNEGGAIKKKEDTHRMAEANRAFAHFR